MRRKVSFRDIFLSAGSSSGMRESLCSASALPIPRSGTSYYAAHVMPVELDIHTRNSRMERIAATMEAHPWMALGGLSILYWAIVLVQSALKLLWLDELITLYVARLGSARAIWSALLHGADPNPPLNHILSMWAMRVFGQNAFGLRLPAMLASWAGLAGLYTFLRAQLPVIFSMIGVCSFMAMGGFDYSSEGRPYALLLCASIVSLLLWRRIVEGRNENLPAIVLALALAVSISSNYFGGLAVFPIAVGEAARTFQQKRFCWRVWLALLAGSASILAYLPLIHSAMTRFIPHAWNKADIRNIPGAYLEMVDYILFPALILLAAVLTTRILRGRGWQAPWDRNREARQGTKGRIFPPHEMAAIITLGLYPVLGYGIATAMSGMIAPRCVIPVCYAFAILIATCTYRLFAGRAKSAICVLAFFLAWIGARESVLSVWLVQQKQAFFSLRDQLPVPSGSEKILVPDCFLVLPFYYYASPDIASRVVFPIDFRAIHKHKDEDSGEQNLWAGRNRVFPMPVEKVASLEAGHAGESMIVAPNDNWFLQELRDAGYHPVLLRFSPHGNHLGDFTPMSRPNPAYFAVNLSKPR